MAIYAVDRDEDDDRFFEKIETCFCDRDIAEQGKTCIFTVNLAGVNSCLNKHDRPSGLLRPLCRQRTVAGRDQHRNITSLAALADRLIRDQIRRFVEILGVLDRFVVTGRFGVVGLLGGRLPFGRDVCGFTLRKADCGQSEQ